MRKNLPLIIFLLFIMSSILVYAESKKWTETEFRSFRVDRFWEETVGNYTCSYTLVTYKNTTTKTFNSAVTIRATIYDSKENKLDTNTRSFFTHEYGPRKPGFEGVLKIPIECEKGRARSVSVGVDHAK